MFLRAHVAGDPRGSGTDPNNRWWKKSSSPTFLCLCSRHVAEPVRAFPSLAPASFDFPFWVVVVVVGFFFLNVNTNPSVLPLRAVQLFQVPAGPGF